MDMVQKSIDLCKIVFVCIVLKAVSLCKISFIVGSQTAFFNGSSLSIPLIGYCAGAAGTILVGAIRLGTWYFCTTHSLHLLSFVIPGFCASLYWTTKSSLLRVWLPLLCMVAFIAHPAGRDAFLYTGYWLIPIAIYVSKRHTLWTQALGSTFIAHAVGSVIWIYTMPTTAAMWLLLIPVVAVERLLCAAGMVALCYGYTYVQHVFDAAHLRIRALVQRYRQA